MQDGADLGWLGLERRDDRWSFTLTPTLARPDGKLFGGAGAAIVVAAAEAETGRTTLWATTQFVGSADLGETVDVRVATTAEGRRTSQVQVTATVGDRLVFVGLGSTGLPRDSTVEVQVPTMPNVPPPDQCGQWSHGHARPGAPGAPDGGHGQGGPAAETPGFFRLTQMRAADESGGAMWARVGEGRQSRAGIAFVADMVPTAVVRAAGAMGGGTSLDNSVRFGRVPDTDWVLLDMDPWMAVDGYLHGGARLWAEDGTLLGVASQTAAAMAFRQPTSSTTEHAG